MEMMSLEDIFRWLLQIGVTKEISVRIMGKLIESGWCSQEIDLWGFIHRPFR